MLNQAKNKVKDNIKITKETDQKIYFEVNSFKGSYNKNMKTQAPQWFKDFAKEMISFKNEMLDFKHEMIEFKTNQEKFNQQLVKRIDNLVVKNNLVE